MIQYEKVSYKYRLLEEYGYSLTWGLMQPAEGKYLVLVHDGVLIIKKGYMWDGPSGPTIDTEDFMRASLVHDALYQLIREDVLPAKYRKKADKLLLAICKEDGMPYFRRQYVYQAVRWFGEMAESDHLGIALAPHHLPQDAKRIGDIAADLGPRVKFFYAQQHGKGSSKKLPKAQEMLQMPGRGPLDFTPILAALKKINYRGLTEIFMHPVPRGIPILDSTQAITAEINRSRRYLEACLKKA